MLKNAEILLSNTKLVCYSCKQLSCTAAGGILNYAQRAFFTFSDLTNKNREYVKKELIGLCNWFTVQYFLIRNTLAVIY
ncbi:uncharacterized protein LOC120770534 isoform X2 [Bactrocera tryoni]|uniref:uncharacterized protein LOC120770534 isoform X2 n=1 Tax=Bactrocera tryoni TaxID=59916 RepID=UPI001A976782|nr:uncharacterized protein LOC120770534 isoform X2 [Bactrocera tryoni]